LGKLPLPPVQEWDCATDTKLEVFTGDIGTLIVGHCPDGCIDKEGQIWGTGIYTRDSSICRAAIHAGVIDDSGGIVEVAI